MRSHPNHFPFASSHAWLVCAGAKGLHGGLWLLFAGIQEYLLENGAGLPPQNAPRAGKPPAANDYRKIAAGQPNGRKVGKP